MNKWIKMALSHPDTPETDPSGLPEPSGRGLSEEDLTADLQHLCYSCNSAKGDR